MHSPCSNLCRSRMIPIQHRWDENSDEPRDRKLFVTSQIGGRACVCVCKRQARRRGQTCCTHRIGSHLIPYLPNKMSNTPPAQRRGWKLGAVGTQHPTRSHREIEMPRSQCEWYAVKVSTAVPGRFTNTNADAAGVIIRVFSHKYKTRTKSGLCMHF